jgi:O-antigen ligase
MYQQFRLRGIVYATALLGTLAAVAYPTIGVVRSRIDDTVMQIRNQFGSEHKRSPDTRLEFYAASCTLIGQHPWAGTGIGSYPTEYRKLSQTRDLPPSVDPHCEYLLLAVQGGVLGLGLFMATLAAQWLATDRLPAEDRYWSQGMLATVAVGSLFNSLLLGFTGGLYYGYLAGLVFGGLVSQEAAGEAQSAGISGIIRHHVSGRTVPDGTGAGRGTADGPPVPASNSNAA